ncbi:uncharacterized protein Z520_04120 [Fonsecaea multimorphosa CBS 102226]|uniref:Uncharacterized protein n=1 Tax=Fonsecaea multimorphosa CBS 102226 TaxID=1442371 RepID=A0A0D2KBE5_9EURO|nr:uncharacterized protein Z520_04120 [Fonsecaea multimorphosa CBS 102226]KIY00435.1 hypothetical protein Z520_04120 [Fonsecaea multimorphosa CBS 102226]OAL26949.1 hypothetical protein AYO22_03893 [Fonsecaea multimorphosa]
MRVLSVFVAAMAAMAAAAPLADTPVKRSVESQLQTELATYQQQYQKYLALYNLQQIDVAVAQQSGNQAEIAQAEATAQGYLSKLDYYEEQITIVSEQLSSAGAECEGDPGAGEDGDKGNDEGCL